ncbi:MAG TPA: zinc ribbon domain-containing protein [Thermoplasmata archaeon]|nr:zinc ribbon domain-containing protein [Thermoplasmata archaeon]
MTVAALAGVVLAFAAVAAVGPAASHYVPQTGDTLAFTETISVGSGTGNYTGYWETTSVNGTIAITATALNGTETATYDYVEHFGNSTGTSESTTASGSFTFSATTFDYVHGTDDQPGDNGTEVWFYLNNTLSSGAAIAPLGTPLTVRSTDATFDLGTSAGGFVRAISASGTGSYERNDLYGVFHAAYLYRAYFDPSTGYILGYTYTENDTNPAGDGFEYADTLAVTHTSFALTSASAPPTYAVSVTESGLPSGTAWTLTFGGVDSSSTATSITLPSVPNGTYLFLLHARGYLASPSGGWVTVHGGAASVGSSWKSFPAASPPDYALYLLVGLGFVVLVVVVVLAIALARRRRRTGGLPRHSAGGMPQFRPPASVGGPPPINLTPGSQPAIQQVVVKEVVKVKCNYCGSLIDSTAPTCPFCGATRS